MWMVLLFIFVEGKLLVVVDFDFGLSFLDVSDECVLVVLELNCSVCFYVFLIGL